MFRKHTVVKTAFLTLLASAALPIGSANAASYLDDGYRVKKGEKTAYTATLSEITKGDIHRTTRTLDWRQPSLQLWFDLPASERTSEITLNLSADPVTRVPGHAPIQVQFNNDKPVPVHSNGHGFEATLSLDPALGRPRRNSLRIIFPAPEGEDCVTPDHGQWSIDLAASNLSIKGRARSGYMSLTELQARLAQPALTPKRIGLLATGPNATDMQALAAQGMALRTPNIPKFSVSDRGTDFNVLMVTRDKLFNHTDDPMVLNSKGPRIFVPKGRPTQLIFTADTDAEILETLKLFTVRRLPKARRPMTSLNEIDMQARLDYDRVLIDKKTKLTDLGRANQVSSFAEDSWASGVKTYRFDVTDPAATKGELLLRLSSSEEVAETSRLRVALNGNVLGAAKLDKRRKSVVFDIPAGKLNASSNLLSLLPELDAKVGYSCPTVKDARPNFMIGNGSKLILKSKGASPASELSSFAATAGVFADQESYIALPNTNVQYEASLRVLARIAKSAGQGLTEADYTRKNQISSDRHVLVIGPANMQKKLLGNMPSAPKTLKDALKGHAVSGDNLLNASIERFASAGANDFAIQYAANNAGPRKISGGGVAALYGNGSGQMIGVISSSSSGHFPTAANRLVESGHWNALRGSVSRWNKTSVLMTQTAQPVSGVSLPSFGQGWGGFTLPTFDMPDWEFPQVSLPDFKWPNFKRSAPVEIRPETALPTLRKAPIQTISMEAPTRNSSVSAAQKTQQISSPAKPRDGFKFVKPELPKIKAPRFSSFHDIRREVKVKWRAVSHWSQKKIDGLMNMRTLKNVERRIDRMQNRVKPSGQKAGQSFLDKLPGQGAVRFADKSYSVFGILLILSFIGVVILMSLASPSSRLGGRH